MKYIDSYQGGDVSFWEVFPYFKELPIFKKLYKEDRSFNKNKSSKTMWYLALSKDIDSEFYSLEDTERQELLFDVLELDVIKFLESKEELDLMLNYFEDFIDTPMSADVRSLEKKLGERKQFIKDTPYTLDEMVYPEEKGKPYLKKGTAAQLDKMMVDTKSIHDELRKLRAALKNEQVEKGKGGKESSFLENG